MRTTSKLNNRTNTNKSFLTALEVVTRIVAVIGLVSPLMYAFAYFYHLGKLGFHNLSIELFPLTKEQILSTAVEGILSLLPKLLPEGITEFALIVTPLFAMVIISVCAARAMLAALKKYEGGVLRLFTRIKPYKDYGKPLVLLAGGVGAWLYTTIAIAVCVILLFAAPYWLGKASERDRFKEVDCSRILTYPCVNLLKGTQKITGQVIQISANYIAITNHLETQVIEVKDTQFSWKTHK